MDFQKPYVLKKKRQHGVWSETWINAQWLEAKKKGIAEDIEDFSWKKTKTKYRVFHVNGTREFLNLREAVAYIEEPPYVKEKDGWLRVDYRKFDGLKIKLLKSPTGKRGRFEYNGILMHKGSYDFVEDQFYTFLATLQIGMDEDFE